MNPYIGDEEVRSRFSSLLKKLNLWDEYAEFTCYGPDFVRLSSMEYALMRGKEVIVHCDIRGAYGESFADTPRERRLKMSEVANLDLSDVGNRALFFAALNSVMNYSGEISGCIHCRGGDADRCGEILAEEVLRRFGRVRVAHIGYQPGHVRACAKVFREVKVTDMNPENIGRVKFGVKILDAAENEWVISKSDVVCVTGSSIVNGTLPQIVDWCNRYGVECVVYGITVKGVAKMVGWDVFCPFGRDSM